MVDKQSTEVSPAEDQMPAVATSKQSFLEWIEGYLPFSIPRIPLPQTAKNLDKAASRIVEAGGINFATRIEASTSKQLAIGKGAVSYIEGGVSSALTNLSPTQDQRALSYVLNQAKIEQSNREDILRLASEDLKINPPIEDANAEISSDWLNTFSRIASEKSDADIQQLFARLLAGEIRNPGAVKLRTLSQLASFDSDDANFVHAFLRNAVSRSWVISAYSDAENYTILLRAMELEIVGQSSAVQLTLNTDNKTNLTMGMRALQISSVTNQDISFQNYPLTTLGSALCAFLGETRPDDRAFDLLVEQFKRDTIILSDVSLGSEVAGGGRRIIDTKQIWPVS